MNVEIGAEAALFPEKEYISGIFVAVCDIGNGIINSLAILAVGHCTPLRYWKWRNELLLDIENCSMMPLTMRPV
jgi:hypothetical protein